MSIATFDWRRENGEIVQSICSAGSPASALASVKCAVSGSRSLTTRARRSSVGLSNRKGGRDMDGKHQQAQLEYKRRAALDDENHGLEGRQLPEYQVNPGDVGKRQRRQMRVEFTAHREITEREPLQLHQHAGNPCLGAAMADPVCERK